MNRGRITIINPGTLEPGLLTVAAVEAIAQASCIVFDAEVRALVEQVAPARAERVELAASLSRAQRTRHVTTAWSRHATVVRIIGGDAVLDGTLSQELQACRTIGRVQVVPGVARITAAAAFSGVSLTGGHSREVVIVDGADPDIDWSTCVEERTTLVILGAGERAATVLRRLVAAGRPPRTPFRFVKGAGSLHQTTVVGEIGDAAASLRTSGSSDDDVLLVGEATRSAIEWFEQQPLFGWRLLLPRTKDAVDDLVARICTEGATCTEVATVSVEGPRTPQQMARAVAGLVEGAYGWVVFTSANSFHAVWERCRALGLDARAFAGTHLAVVGADTAAALSAHGLAADLGPCQTTAELLEHFPEPIADALDRVLVPRAEIATETLASGLVAVGWEVEEVTAFRIVRSAPPEPEVRDDIKSGAFDAVLFTSAATVRNLIGLAGKPHPRTVVACIGSQTAKAAEEHGLRVDCIAEAPTVESLLAALVKHAQGLQHASLEAGVSGWRPSAARAVARRKAK